MQPGCKPSAEDALTTGLSEDVEGASGHVGLLDDFFRRQYGQCVAFLTRRLGSQQMALAEEAVQEALVRALRVWPQRGIPNDPAAWILRVAHRHAIDLMRRVSRWEHWTPADVERMVGELSGSEVGFAGELVVAPNADDSLAMMFMCCHPSLPPLSRVALTLKVVSGFGVPEIAAACFAAPATVAQRIVRAKSRLRELGVSMEIPSPELLSARLNSVLDVIYLLFNEGYTCRDGESPLQLDLIVEALRLMEGLLNHEVGQQPRAYALAALLCLQASRSRARVDEDGGLVPLQEQDRLLWEQGLIMRGLGYLQRAAFGAVLTEYHLLAGIAACHATATSPTDTPWQRIAGLYDQLVSINGTFVTMLNRAVAHSRAYGPERGLSLLDELADRKALQTYHLMAAARADCLMRLRRFDEARDAFVRAAKLSTSLYERGFFMSRAEALDAIVTEEREGVLVLFPGASVAPLAWHVPLDEDDKSFHQR